MATSKKTTKTSANGARPKNGTAARSSATSNGKPKPNGRPRPKLGRSRIPIDAPLEVVFEHDHQARAAFDLLGISTIRELQKFDPDELVMRLTSPTKQTVGRIRKMLALNNRCLDGDERFALGVQREQ